MSDARRIIIARRLAAKAVAEAFLPVEAGADDTAVAASRCVAMMIEQRAAVAFGPTAGAEALRLMQQGSSLAFQAQATFREAHAQLAELSETFGLDAFFAPECPPNAEVAGTPRMKIVA